MNLKNACLLHPAVNDGYTTNPCQAQLDTNSKRINVSVRGSTAETEQENLKKQNSGITKTLKKKIGRGFGDENEHLAQHET